MPASSHGLNTGDRKPARPSSGAKATVSTHADTAGATATTGTARADALLRLPIWAVRQRFRRWWQSRLPPTDTFTLTQRTVFILPTRAGWMMAATLLVLLIASINYQLNLGYLLTFLLAGSAVAGMHAGHGTLRGLNLALMPPAPQFAGRAAMLDVVLANTRKRPRYGIGLAVQDGTAAPQWSWADVAAGGSSTVQLAFKPERRGLHTLPTLTAETRFPLGIFRVWTLWRPAARILVYPTPEPFAPPLPPGQPRGPAGVSTSARGSGEFDGVRAYRRGDPLKQVVWKKAAQSGELVSRDTQQPQRQALWLDFTQAGVADVEHRLSRLTAWVLQAEQLGLDYGLRVPGRELAPDAGEAHKLRCLEALATC